MHSIIAIATPPQNGAIGVIRLSGPEALKSVLPFLKKTKRSDPARLEPRRMTFVHFVTKQDEVLDKCLAVYMPGPHTFTGEDVVELHCHGNLYLLRRIIRELLVDSEDLRAAEPGEFSKRAFLNGKMDLSQAEAVHATISASSEAALRASLANLDGRLFRLVKQMRADLKSALALIEASFEFPEEDIQTFDPNAVKALLASVEKQLLDLKSGFRTSKILDLGVSVAIIGQPNVGKSSLSNALLVEDRSIVTDVPGTTRDVVESSKMIGGIKFVLRDTAGLRAAADFVEAIGVEKSYDEARRADIVLLLVAPPEHQAPVFNASGEQIILKVFNKIDLECRQGETFGDAARRVLATRDFDLAISAKEGFGIEALEKKLLEAAQKNKNVQNNVHTNERQNDKILKGIDIIETIKKCDIEGFAEELVADELRRLVSTLGEITGEVTSDEVLGEVFSRFCIGK